MKGLAIELSGQALIASLCFFFTVFILLTPFLALVLAGFLLLARSKLWCSQEQNYDSKNVAFRSLSITSETDPPWAWARCDYTMWNFFTHAHVYIVKNQTARESGSKSGLHMTAIRMWLSIKPQATVYEIKSTDMHNCNTKGGSMHVMPGLNGCCMHTGLAHHVLCRSVYTEVALSPTCSSMWPLERSVHVTSDFHCEWAIVATQTMASTDETFLPWGSPYRCSHWIGRSTSGLRPYCCHRGGTAVRWVVGHCILVNSFWINEWRKNSQNKSRKWLTAWRTIYISYMSAGWRSTVHDRHQISVLYSLSGAHSGSPQ